jgi:hypothetical protein
VSLFFTAILWAADNEDQTRYDPAEKPHAVGSPAELMQNPAFNCWINEAPAGVMPTHVVITENGKARIAGARKVHEALESLFNGAITDIEAIHGFCEKMNP